MEPFFAIDPLAGSIQTALEQPAFPGKIVIWLLFMLSIVSWVMIVSKAMHLAKMRRVDRRFSHRLRQSRTTLEVFEEGWDDPRSLQHLIYLAGAREAAYQLLGSREPQKEMQDRIRKAPKLAARQLDFLNLAFRSGYRTALLKLSSGIAGFRFVAAGALLLGSLGMVWTLMRGFDQASNFAEIAPMVGGALGFLAIALMVAAPAILARIAFDIHIRRRKVELTKFRDDVARLFERSYAAPEPARDAGPGVSAEPSRPGGSDFESGGEAAGEGTRKKFHSIRDRLLRGPDSDEDEDEEEEGEINPIAKQAATLRTR
ncbi:MAG: hypothetical protein WD342_14010 [Verrucomicrobiales bacterium]